MNKARKTSNSECYTPSSGDAVAYYIGRGIESDEVDFSNLPTLSSRTMALGSAQSLTEMSIRNLPGGKVRPARRTDDLTAICEPIV
jgi:hypothetical protein